MDRNDEEQAAYRQKRRKIVAASRQRRREAIAAMPKIPCACGCGELIPPITTGEKPARYKLGHNQSGGEFQPGHDKGHLGSDALRALGKLSGSGHWNWHGGEWYVRGGYVRIRLDPAEAAKHPTAICPPGNSWSIPRSHYIWNTHHPDDPVRPGEQVHHRNHVRDDDRIENLTKMDRGDHLRHHNALVERDRDEQGRYS